MKMFATPKAQSCEPQELHDKLEVDEHTCVQHTGGRVNLLQVPRKIGWGAHLPGKEMDFYARSTEPTTCLTSISQRTRPLYM